MGQGDDRSERPPEKKGATPPDPTRAAPTRSTDATETAGTGPTPGPPQETPASIGSYRILGKLGEGGMGVVYEAEQESPRRRVAVKVVRGGQFLDEARLRLFQREADTLARLKHPNIAAIYESGRTEDGQHFFAMEMVRGPTLNAYLRGRPRDVAPEELSFRLGLFRKIADAVHYAHQRGVIHRDLKPSNILVVEGVTREESTATGSSRGFGPQLPEIKILDFGLARITEGDVAAATMTTEVGQIKGTLPYMSPEQARGIPEEIDLRTDVYALGVILYEMLTGSRPYEPTRTSLIDAVRLICEEPPKPLKQAWSGARRLDPDVETIVGKALEKDAHRRYASAAALSDDVARYLTSQPILARPPSTVYQLRKFARRNRALVGGVVATFTVLVAGIVVSTAFGLREAEQRRATQQALADLEAVAEFQEGMLSELEPEQMGRRLIEDLRERTAEARRRQGDSADEVAAALGSFDDLMREVNSTDVALRVVDEDILDPAGRTIAERFGEQPLIAARLRQTIGRTYRELGLYERAEADAALALQTRERELGPDHPDTLEAGVDLAVVYYRQGRYDEAESLLLETLDTQRRVLGDDDPDTLDCINALANVYYLRGRYDEAEPLYLEALEARRRVLGDEHPDTAQSVSNLANLYKLLGRHDEAERMLLEAVATRKRVLGEDDPLTLYSMNSLAGLYVSRGRHDEAEQLYLEALEKRRRVLGDDHPETLAVENNLANLYTLLGRHDEAERIYLRAIAAYKRTLGEEHPDALRTMGNLADLYDAEGRHEEAERLFLEVLAAQKRVLGDEHPDTHRTMNALASLYADLSRYGDAAPLIAGVLATRRKALGDEHPDTLSAMDWLADCLRRQSRYDEAEKLMLESLASRRRTLGSDEPATLYSVSRLALLYKLWGRHDEAERLYRELLATRRRVLGGEHPSTLQSANNLADLLMIQGRHDEAEPVLREALAGAGRLRDAGDPSVGVALHNLACVRREAGDYEEAHSLFEQAQAVWEAKLPPDHPYFAENLEQHAKLLRLTGENAAADRLEARAESIRSRQ